ncbi:flagellar hook capping FlgD N-terminal domain-containing protein [uncultured Litoreibacter sp.]|uniref:flagellar hook capping FlgD N-terminal domain-containing protein n=1 Tax=uncultured Litoreibacter sp. TaxID=1392394 RepID=UPI002622387B|nr:flagellar hook capping FlgD N-terminal domain-containing protein [uncultured Litoreibacter sp.]
MDVSNPTLSSGPQNPAPQSRATALSSDFETFLVMLTAQMKNQDPLNPLDSQDFATQLATFSGVEQQVQTNDLLTALGSQFASSSLADMAGWVGMEARMAVPVQFNGTPVEFVPNPPIFADKTELVVWDSAGNEVQRMDIPVTDDAMEWAGVDENGNPFPDGEYSFGIVAYSDGEVIDEAVPEVFARVSEVRTVNGQPLVVLEGGQLYPSSLVRGLR